MDEILSILVGKVFGGLVTPKNFVVKMCLNLPMEAGLGGVCGPLPHPPSTLLGAQRCRGKVIPQSLGTAIVRRLYIIYTLLDD